VRVRFSEIGKVLNHTIEKFVTLTAEVWKGFNRNELLYTPSGDDSPPCAGDQIILVKVDGTGKYAAVGVLDVSQGAKPGEKILYCRDADGAVKAKISMLNDGTVKIEAEGDVSVDTKGAHSVAADGDASVDTKGAYNVSAAGDISVSGEKNVTQEAAQKHTIKGADVDISGKVKATGGSFECGGSVSPSGSGALCGVPFCLFTGAPHAGKKAEGT
jgi:hypothetical protein